MASETKRGPCRLAHQSLQNRAVHENQYRQNQNF